MPKKSMVEQPSVADKKPRPDMDWSKLEFGYYKTDFNIRFTWREGQWDAGRLTAEESIPLHIAATCLHYGQACFEGLKAFETRDGRIVVFRPDENAKRIRRSCEKLLMPAIPEDMFLDAVMRVVQANRRFVPPYGTGASLYIRPLVIGTGPQVGVKPAKEYLFMIFVTPVGPYFKTGFKPVDVIVEYEVDRAAPLGVGDVKAAGNYAAGLRATEKAKAAGYPACLYLDAKEKKYIDESGPANFFAITPDNQYITPASSSILPSITNMSLIALAEEMGLRPERRRIPVDEIPTFKEAGCCGTAAVITPIRSIVWKGKEYVYCPDGEPGPISTQLYKKLKAIQVGDAPDKHNWLYAIDIAD
jgi:branched-chain amino acid aminotransferase